MALIRFWLRCLRRGFKPALEAADAILLIVPAFGTAIAYIFGYEVEINAPWWLVVLAVIVVLVILRVVVVAPFELWHEGLAAEPRRVDTTRDRTPLVNLREWAIEAGWDADILSIVTGGNDFLTFAERLGQAAVDGQIQFWGRNYRYTISEAMKDSQKLVKIDASHFVDFELDVQELAQSKNYDIFTRKLGFSRDQLRDQCFRDLHIDATQAREWLRQEGKAPPSASFNIELVVGPGQIGDYNCVCAVIVKNTESKDLKNCLVQIDKISFTRPDKMPLPLVLRTEGQIGGSRTGRFTLSPGQPKSVPILFRKLTRAIEWFFVDENGNSYFVPAQHSKLVLGIYGGESNSKALVDILVGDDWSAYPSLRIVSDDFELSETANSGTN